MSNFVEICANELRVGEHHDRVISSHAGAVVMFTGHTRDHFEGKTVETLAYEAYLPMAEQEMKKICESIREKWTVANISMGHRIGTVGIKEVSVVVAVSSEHRKEAFLAAEFAIDTIKAKVPIWKKEVYSDQKPSWKQNKECFWTDKKEESKYEEEGVLLKLGKSDLKNSMNEFINKQLDISGAHIQHQTQGHDSSCSRTIGDFLTRQRNRAPKIIEIYNPRENNAERREKEFDPSECLQPPKNKMHKYEGEEQDGEMEDDSGAEQRIVTIEEHLNIPRDKTSNVFARIKVIEDKILDIEKCGWTKSKGLPTYISVRDYPQNLKVEEDEVCERKLKTISEVELEMQNVREEIRKKQQHWLGF